MIQGRFTFHSRSEWLAFREGSIGSSDLPKLLGLGYSTGDNGPPSDSTRLRFGRFAEPFVLEEAKRRCKELAGVELCQDFATYARVLDGVQFHATPDAETGEFVAAIERMFKVGSGRIVELKTATLQDAPWFNRWGVKWIPTAPFPSLYSWLQLQHQLVVAGGRWGVVACLFGAGESFSMWAVNREPKFERVMAYAATRPEQIEEGTPAAQSLLDMRENTSVRLLRNAEVPSWML